MVQKISIFLLLTIGLLPQASRAMQPTATQELLTFIKNFRQQPVEIRKKLGAENIKTITDYIAKGAHVNAQLDTAQTKGKNYTLLHQAIFAEIIDPELYTTLLAAGANPLIKDSKQRTARTFFDNFYAEKIAINEARIELLNNELDEVRHKTARQAIIEITKNREQIEDLLKTLHDISEMLKQAEKNYAQAQEQLSAEQKGTAQAPAKKPKKGVQFAATLAEAKVFHQDELVKEPTKPQNARNDLAQLHTQLLTLSTAAA